MTGGSRNDGGGRQKWQRVRHAGERRDGGECGDDDAYRSGAREMQVFPGNANLRIGTQADHDEDSHSDPHRYYAPGHTPINVVLTCLLPVRRLAFPGWRILCFWLQYFVAESIQAPNNSQ